MSNVSQGSPVEGRRSARRRDDFARDLEILAQRLAESRETIVRLLAAVVEDAGAVPQEPSRTSVTPLRALRSAPGRAAPAGTEGGGKAGTGQDGLALGQDGQDREPLVTLGKARGGEDAAGRRAGAARRRVLSVVLVAVGAVVILTTIVSLL
jgi:hypothetical protein